MALSGKLMFLGIRNEGGMGTSTLFIDLIGVYGGSLIDWLPFLGGFWFFRH